MKKSYLFLFLIIIIAISIFTVRFLPDYLSVTYNDLPVEIEVKKGANLNSVAEDLYEKNIIRSRLWFRYNGQDIARSIKPGTYTIPSKVELNEVYEILQNGEDESQIKLTFPEGFILYQFAKKVEESGLASSEEFIKETDDYFNKMGYTFDPSNLYFKMEGYLFPDTYYFTKDQSVTEIVTKLAETMEDVFTDEYLNKAKEMNLTTHDVLTIASLIEREADNDEERARISGVIYNRLDIGMPLQIDASVIYGLGEGKEHKTKVLLEDLKVDNPFNTYKNPGLPPGPIASPGKKSIQAALYPEEHDYFYYVMGENGHVFAKTFAEHENNIKKYRK